jgi:hypothetical protein
MRLAKYAEAYAKLDTDIDPSQFPFCEDIQVDLGDIFDLLHLHLDCCRVRICTQVEFTTLY